MVISAEGGKEEGWLELWLEVEWVDSEGVVDTEVVGEDAVLDSEGDFSEATRDDGALGVGNGNSRWMSGVMVPAV